MRSINIKQLKDSLCKELKDLPFSITVKGKVVATCIEVATNKVATPTITHAVATSKEIEDSIKGATTTVATTEVATFTKQAIDKKVATNIDKDKINKKGKYKTFFK